MKENSTPSPKKSSVGTPKISPEEKKRLTQLLLNLPEEKVKKRFEDKQLDREYEKNLILTGGAVSIDMVKRYIQSIARPYEPMYPITYFREIYRLLGYPVDEANKYRRRREVAIFTREAIYGSFDMGVLMSFHVLNPYTGYIRRNYKHFQFMTDHGIAQLAVVISDAIEMMGTCTTMLEFRKKWHGKYGVPYQTDLFTE